MMVIISSVKIAAGHASCPSVGVTFFFQEVGMKGNRISAALLLGLMGIACGSSAPPPQTAVGVTSAQRVDTNTASWRLAGARCKHASSCNEIGGNRTYPSTDGCISENRGKAESDLRPADCPHGVDSTRLDSCLSAVSAEACSGIGSGFTRMMACKTSALCP